MFSEQSGNEFPKEEQSSMVQSPRSSRSESQGKQTMSEPGPQVGVQVIPGFH